MISVTGVNAVLLASLLLGYSVGAVAEPPERKKARRGPPPEALQICSGATVGQNCTFAGRRGEVTGTCAQPPQHAETNALACVPEGHRGGRRGKGEDRRPPPEGDS